MSYEGYKEFLCDNGHYSRGGCWDDDETACQFCGAAIAFRNSVDVTNGQDESEPWSMPGPKQQVGWDDDWKADHYGNPPPVPWERRRMSILHCVHCEGEGINCRHCDGSGSQICERRGCREVAVGFGDDGMAMCGDCLFEWASELQDDD